jgi:Fe-S cluster biogenesis protein NfuA
MNSIVSVVTTPCKYVVRIFNDSEHISVCVCNKIVYNPNSSFQMINPFLRRLLGTVNILSLPCMNDAVSVCLCRGCPRCTASITSALECNFYLPHPHLMEVLRLLLEERLDAPQVPFRNWC